MLFAELAGFTYTFNLLFFESGESNDDSIRLHALELLKIDMAVSFLHSSISESNLWPFVNIVDFIL